MAFVMRLDSKSCKLLSKLPVKFVRIPFSPSARPSSIPVGSPILGVGSETGLNWIVPLPILEVLS